MLLLAYNQAHSRFKLRQRGLWKWIIVCRRFRLSFVLRQEIGAREVAYQLPKGFAAVIGLSFLQVRFPCLSVTAEYQQRKKLFHSKFVSLKVKYATAHEIEDLRSEFISRFIMLIRQC